MADEIFVELRLEKGSTADVLYRAADEIQRLRAELADYKRTVRALEAELAEETSGYE